MQIGESCSLAEALRDWGTHEGLGLIKNHRRLPPEAYEGAHGLVISLESLLMSRPGLVALVLAAIPIQCFRAVLELEDVPRLRSFDDRGANDYTDFMIKDPDPKHGGHVRGLVQRPGRVEGPLLAVARAPDISQPVQVIEPIGILDGNHRMAAWIAKGRGGDAHPIAANLV